MSAAAGLIVLDTEVCGHLCRGDAYGAALEERFELKARRVAPMISAVTVGEVLRRARRLAPLTRWDVVQMDTLNAMLRNLNVVPLAGPVALEFARLSARLDDSGQATDSARVWVAATASAMNATVLSHHSDFTVFKDEVRCEIVDRIPILLAAGERM